MSEISVFSFIWKFPTLNCNMVFLAYCSHFDVYIIRRVLHTFANMKTFVMVNIRLQMRSFLLLFSLFDIYLFPFVVTQWQSALGANFIKTIKPLFRVCVFLLCCNALSACNRKQDLFEKNLHRRLTGLPYLFLLTCKKINPYLS